MKTNFFFSSLKSLDCIATDNTNRKEILYNYSTTVELINPDERKNNLSEDNINSFILYCTCKVNEPDYLQQSDCTILFFCIFFLYFFLYFLFGHVGESILLFGMVANTSTLVQ